MRGGIVLRPADAVGLQQNLYSIACVRCTSLSLLGNAACLIATGEWNEA